MNHYHHLIKTQMMILDLQYLKLRDTLKELPNIQNKLNQINQMKNK